MYTALLILLLIDCFALVVAVLLQAGKGGGLAAGFGGAGTGMEMMGSRQTVTFLHSATRWLGGAFLVICFVLSLLTVRGTAPRSLIESEMQSQQQAAPPDAPTGPYAIVRHPMYASGILYLVGTPLALGSWWGLLAIAATLPFLIWRLLDEERFLARSLPGYAEYQRRVRHRLVPHVW